MIMCSGNKPFIQSYFKTERLSYQPKKSQSSTQFFSNDKIFFNEARLREQMGNLLQINPVMTAEQNKAIEQTVEQERGRLYEFIKQRIADPEEAEDILQDVFFQLVETYRMMKPVEKMVSWLFTVARNKIIDRYRKKKPDPFSAHPIYVGGEEGEEAMTLADILPALTDSPEQQMLRSAVWEELEAALLDLPEVQRQVFIWHELEGKSFKEMAAMTGEPVNTLISRKRYAILFLRERLQEIYEELMTD